MSLNLFKCLFLNKSGLPLFMPIGRLYTFDTFQTLAVIPSSVLVTISTLEGGGKVLLGWVGT